MSNYIQIQWTCGTIDEARKVCSLLVESRQVACANIFPDVESIYSWDGKICHDKECKVLLKTTKDKWDIVKKIILENCSYEVPEIICFDINDGHEKYFEWVNRWILGK